MERLKGEIWCATEKEGVYVFAADGKLLRGIPYRTKAGGSFSLRYALAVDASGRVWATNGKSLFVLDGLSVAWQEYKLGLGNIFRIGNGRQGSMYLTASTGLYEAKPKGNQLDISPCNLFAGLETHDGILTFFGSSGKVYTYSNGKTIVAKTGMPEKQIRLYASDATNCIWEDPAKQRTWFGTTKGLAYWDWESDNIKAVDKTGFDQAMITSIAGDGTGKLWLGTYNGLFSYDPATGESHHFPAEEGLPSGNISLSASLTASDGKIWFGTANGPVLFDPLEMKPYPHGPRVHIESFEINNQPYLGVPVASEASRIELDYFQNSLAFGLKAVGFYLPKMSTIRYRLKGFEEEWQELENGGLIRYPKLPPGDFQLELVALNVNGVKGAPHALNIFIRPPWWQRWWFRALLIGALVGAVYLSFRLYLRRKLLEQQRIFERQKALQDERNRIAAELHDDLGAGLSIIRFLSDHSLQQPQSGDQRQSIHRIYQSAGELLEKMGDIIWAMNAENDNLPNLAAHLQGYAYEYLDVNGIQCSFQLPETIPAIELSGAQRRNILLAFKESLHNAVKHAQATAVSIRLQTDSVHFILSIHDNGRGIDLGKLRAGGNGVRNIAKRMEAIGGSAEFQVDNGTVVLLKMPISL
ncbi:MAG: hypothetical protein IPN76_23010 [Saprospiraceae bacterium]|nr:hypothetical protein [Saprospiraceae bacterium]